MGHNVGDSFDVTVTFPDGYGGLHRRGRQRRHPVGQRGGVPRHPEQPGGQRPARGHRRLGGGELRRVQRPAHGGGRDQYFHDSLYSSNLTNAVVDYLTENSTVSSIPEVVLNYQVCSQLSYYNSYAAMFGYETLDEFLAGFMGYDNADALLADTEQDVLNSCKPAADLPGGGRKPGPGPHRGRAGDLRRLRREHGRRLCPPAGPAGQRPVRPARWRSGQLKPQPKMRESAPRECVAPAGRFCALLAVEVVLFEGEAAAADLGHFADDHEAGGVDGVDQPFQPGQLPGGDDGSAAAGRAGADSRPRPQAG